MIFEWEPSKNDMMVFHTDHGRIVMFSPKKFSSADIVDVEEVLSLFIKRIKRSAEPKDTSAREALTGEIDEENEAC